MSENIINATDATFADEVLQEKLPVLVDFWAAWCAPCKMLIPVLEEVAAEYKNKIKFVKVDVDANNETASQYGIRNIPTLIIFQDGKIVDTKIGSLSKVQLVAFLNKAAKV
jgi:thioredoxin 1